MEKYNNLEKLLLDIRDGTKTFYEEKRRFQRTMAQGQLSAKITNKEIDGFIRVLNISYNGALLRLPMENVVIGEVLYLNMYLPLFPQPIDLSGRVVRLEPAYEAEKKFLDAGIEYLNIARPDREKLTETVNMLYKTGQTE